MVSKSARREASPRAERIMACVPSASSTLQTAPESTPGMMSVSWPLALTLRIWPSRAWMEDLSAVRSPKSMVLSSSKVISKPLPMGYKSA